MHGHGRRVAVDDLVVRDAGHRAADDVAGDVAARPGRRQADRLEPAQDLGHRRERDPVDLDALAGGAVQHAAAVVLGDPRQDLGLLARQDALHDLHAEHEVAVLRVVLVQPVPLEPEEVVVAECVPPLARAPQHVLACVERVLLMLDAFVLVHLADPNPVSNGLVATRYRSTIHIKPDRL